MSSAVTQLAKPQLRGMLNAAIKRNIIVALVLTAISGVATKTLLCDARKQKYADFYKNYDAMKDFERMRQAGVFQSVSAD